MGGGDDKASVQAQHALIDPLFEPDPSDVTGLNSHFGSTFAPRQKLPTPPGSAGHKKSSSVNIRPQSTGTSIETNPYRRSRASSVSQEPRPQFPAASPRKGYNNVAHYPSPPASASPRRERFPQHLNESFASSGSGVRPRRSSQPNPFNDPPQKSTRVNRSGSLQQRFPGDQSHRPLDIIRKDTKTAHRAHHLRKKNFQGADIIDRLDKTTSSYHHEGPYDAASLARNLSYKHSPVAAVQDSNEEALKATPRENILNSVHKHHPMDGTALVPPGVPDQFGRTYDYQEGADLMHEPGADYKRWPGVKYHPDDLKGKGEPSFSQDRARKEHKAYGESGTEMQTHRRNFSTPGDITGEGHDRSSLGRSNTTGKGVGTALKKRFGSIRRRKADA